MENYQETSRDAYEFFAKHSPTLDELIVASLRVAPKTCNDIEKDIGRSHQAVSGNLRHLVEKGKVENSGEQGVTDSGRPAIKWRIPC